MSALTANAAILRGSSKSALASSDEWPWVDALNPSTLFMKTTAPLACDACKVEFAPAMDVATTRCDCMAYRDSMRVARTTTTGPVGVAVAPPANAIQGDGTRGPALGGNFTNMLFTHTCSTMPAATAWVSLHEGCKCQFGTTGTTCLPIAVVSTPADPQDPRLNVAPSDVTGLVPRANPITPAR